MPLEFKVSNLNYRNEIVLYEKTNFEIGPQIKWLHFYYQKKYSWKKIGLCHNVNLHTKFNLYVKIAKCQMPMIVTPL
jgi:hypothetical protein